MPVFTRSLARIDHFETRQGMTPEHRVRPLPRAAMRRDWAAAKSRGSRGARIPRRRKSRSAPRAPLRALLYVGRPLREPVAARGPFVMNSEAEIMRAYADCRAGLLGPSDSAAAGQT